MYYFRQILQNKNIINLFVKIKGHRNLKNIEVFSSKLQKIKYNETKLGSTNNVTALQSKT